MTKVKIARSYETYEPTSMLPADGWKAVFAYYDDEEGYAHTSPLVAFALTKICHVDIYENGHETTDEEICIVGYTASDIGIHPAEEAHNFMGYLAPGMRILDHMEQRAKKYVLASKTAKEPTNESP